MLTVRHRQGLLWLLGGAGLLLGPLGSLPPFSLVQSFSWRLPTVQAQTSAVYRTGLRRWQAGDPQGFQQWLTRGIRRNAKGQFLLDPENWQQGSGGGPAHPAQPYWVGEAISPVVPTAFPAKEAIVSWNVTTPPGTWVEVGIRAQVQNRWTKWYHGGVWASDPSTLVSHSVPGQGDEDGDLHTDVLVLNHPSAEAFQVKLRLFTQDPRRSPLVEQVAMAVSGTPIWPDHLQPGDPGHWGKVLPLPQCSQMVYPDGGSAWCSPTALAMVMAYWQRDSRPCEPMVRAAVAGVYDRTYRGHGNWVFNVAYAAEQGLSGLVARLESLAQAEAWIAAGVPLILSYAWAEGELQGAPLPRSNGHLAVLVGFDAQGDPILHDPAAPTDAEVRRTYPRRQLEPLWLKHSGGTVYLIYPQGWPVPALQD